MHNHLEKSDGRNADIFEVVGVGLPWPCIANGSLFGGVVGVEGILLRINKLDIIVELCVCEASASDHDRENLNTIKTLPQLLKAFSIMETQYGSCELSSMMTLLEGEFATLPKLWWGLVHLRPSLI